MTMTTRTRHTGLQHATSLGHIEVLEQSSGRRSYDSEDENMGRRRTRPYSTILNPRTTPIYSRGDIREQYCLSDKQLSSIERPRLERFFGCWSGNRSSPFLGVCVGRRAPSDENLNDFNAPFSKHHRYYGTIRDGMKTDYDDDQENSVFRRKPTSFISNHDAKRYTWSQGGRSQDTTTGNFIEDNPQGPHALGYASGAYLSHSSEHLAGAYRCPAHTGLPPPPPPPSMHQPDEMSSGVARTKHVSFARSHTLTSFDEAMLGRSVSRLNAARSQERLIGGKKAAISLASSLASSSTSVATLASQHHQMQQQHIQQQMQQHIHQHMQHSYQHGGQICALGPAMQPEILVVEKQKRGGVMKTQATQTEVKQQQQQQQQQRSMKTSSQSPHVNGFLSNRSHTASMPEVAHRMTATGVDMSTRMEDHDPLCRTQSEEPPRSPYESQFLSRQNYDFDFLSQHSLTSNQLDSMHSDAIPTKPSCHSRNLSQDSAASFKTIDVSLSQVSRESGGTSSVHFSEQLTFSRPDSTTTDIGFDHYTTNSLPRQPMCDRRHRPEFRSLPRRSDAIHFPQQNAFRTRHEHSSRNSSVDDDDSRIYVNMAELKRSNRMQQSTLPRRRSSVHSTSSRRVISTDDRCSVCESDTEQEIFIDFKPQMKPEKSPKQVKKTFKKQMSEGEILFDSRTTDLAVATSVASASEEDLKTPDDDPPSTERYLYRSEPIKDEGICDPSQLLAPVSDEAVLRHRREAFRKRSISTDDGSIDELSTCVTLPPKISSPSSPCLSVKACSNFPSSDSLATDWTRDNSDGIWNESQATVLHADPSPSSSAPSLATPSSKRKNLLLQHLQRSSMDTEALEMEDFINGENGKQFHSASNHSIHANTITTMSSHRSVCSPHVGQPPLITTTHPSVSTEEDEHQRLQPTPCSRPTSPSRRKRSIEPVCSNLSSDSPERSARTNSTPDLGSGLHSHSGESGRTTHTDISECSTTTTNTEEYVSCGTDNSRRTNHAGTKNLASASSSSATTHMPASGHSSQTATQDGGSSFESASSLYSLARADAICDDNSLLDDSLPLPPTPPSHSTYHSRSQSVCSSSSNEPPPAPLPETTRRNEPPLKQSSPITVKPITAVPPKFLKDNSELDKSESVSDEDKSEKRYSSSGYYESPQDDEKTAARLRRSREWNEEDRRRRKEKMRLDIEKENMKSLTSPIKKQAVVAPSSTFQQISPDDRVAMNVLDGTSPNKGKRFRPKTRRNQDDTLPRRAKTPIVIRSEETTIETTVHQPTSSTVSTKVCPTAVSKDPEAVKRLKAISTESLRSVSPGSDSVFYSEADTIVDHQVHCHNCGKQVEIVTALSGSEETIVGVDEVVIPIVQPPADFADSPNGTRAAHGTRLYKKMDKRFRSEERQGDRRMFRARQENTRAKSEERGKECAFKAPTLRPAGSSPCVAPEGSFNMRDQPVDPEQGIYHGFYRLGTWLSITDRDVWMKHDLGKADADSPNRFERRGSTDSEKDFRKKYSAITHRMVHRKSCVEMYRRQETNAFTEMVSTQTASPDSLRKKLEEIFKLMLMVWAKEGIALSALTGLKNATDKHIVVHRKSGEFGFRIHGSKPVVVSAIEPDTPAETTGLEVGDIVLSVNGVPVIDKSHSEVVKIAHAGSDVLELEVARTAGHITTEAIDAATPSLYSGYLWRQGGPTGDDKCKNKKWTRRWFSLRPDHCLYFYKTDSDPQPVGAVLLTNHTVENVAADLGRPFAFRISSGEGYPLYLAADSEEAASRWVAVTSHAAKQSDPWLEVSTRNLKLPPNSVPRPDCFGYLMKLGSRWRTWSKRYCVLKDACLYFYHDGNSKNAFGMACLQGYRVQQTNNSVGKKHAFEIAPPEPKLRHYYFSTESEMDKRRWLAALEYSIDRWMKAA